MKSQILVAIDPFARDQLALKRSMKTTQAIADALDADLKPVSVVSPDQVQWPSRFDGEWAHQFELAADQRLRGILKGTALSTDAETILMQPNHSLKASARLLSDFAKDKKAKVIVAFTHYRKAPHFRLFGSFATALISQSSVPVLFVNAKGKSVSTYKRIIFATDFSDGSEVTFKIALDWAKEFNAAFTIFHSLTAVSPEVYASVGIAGGFLNFDLYVAREEARAKEVGERWVKMAIAAGCKAEFIIRHSNIGPAKEVIDAASRLKADLIFVASNASGFDAFILGSVTRDILEISTLPVVVVPATITHQTPNKVSDTESTNIPSLSTLV